jgi:ELWxxDGT repeat protein
MRKLLGSFRLQLVTAALFLAPAASAITLEWRTVGDPGNSCDPQPLGCIGAVADTYQISRYEVTNAQYAAFLNAVADADPNLLYNTSMSSGSGGITRSGVSGSYVYSVVSGRGSWPVTWVSYYDAIRFANWLHNNQPVGAQGNATTEDGAYTITPAGIAANSIARNSVARAFVPSHDEWHKAAYHYYSSYDDGTFYGTGFYDYPAGSDAQTTCAEPGATWNTANCGGVVGNLTPVGSYPNSASFWGTFDQGGNAREWTEAIVAVLGRGERGAGFGDAPDHLAASGSLDGYLPTVEYADLGFRIARALPRPYRVADIAPGATGSFPSLFANVNGTLYFAASHPTYGNELWKSDGTAGGTVLVKDIRPGTSDAGPFHFTNVNGTLFFTANDGTRGYELWKSDGTSAGTVIVRDIRSGALDSFPDSLTNLDGTLHFGADNGTNGHELWKSNGTSAGTVLVKDIWAGATSSWAGGFTNLNGTLYFQASDGFVRGSELWKTNGTAAGTVLVKDIAVGSSDSSPWGFIHVDGALYFQATDGLSGVELWKSDGTAAGTVRVKDIYSGVGSSNPTVFKDMNGTLFFQASDGFHGAELWKSDGTDAGTVLVKDIAPGGSDSYPYYATDVNSTLFFQARNASSGGELWKSDGTAAGTVLVKDFVPGTGDSWPRDLVDVKGTLLLAATVETGGDGFELWQSDGTSDGTLLVEAIWPGPNGANPNPTAQSHVNGTLFFRASDGVSGSELWAYEVLDSDGDELSDFAEAGSGTNPFEADGDGDGLSDGVELQRGTDPFDDDTDDDGLEDGEEVLVHGTDPLDSDSDDDGFDDGFEIAIDANPNDSEDPGFDPSVSNGAIQASDQPKYRWRYASSGFSSEFVAPSPYDDGDGICSMAIPSEGTCSGLGLGSGCLQVSLSFASPPPPPSGSVCCTWEARCELTCANNTCDVDVVCPGKAPGCSGTQLCVNEDLDCRWNQSGCNDEYERLLGLGVPPCCFASAGATSFQWSSSGLQTPIDTDGDRVPDACDNCDFLDNPAQADLDQDGIGDACDDALLVAACGIPDTDGDGVGDACDTEPPFPDHCTDTDADNCDDCGLGYFDTANDHLICLPEPASAAGLAAGLVTLCMLARRRSGTR